MNAIAHHRLRRSLFVGVACALVAGQASAQYSFEQGSFLDTTETTGAPDSAPATTDDAFCGSFGCDAEAGGGGAITPDPEPPTENEGVPDGDTSDGGAADVPDDQTVITTEEEGGTMPPDGADEGQAAPDPYDDPNSSESRILAFETRDFGVPPQQNLRQGQFHGPTPTILPGGQVISTQDLIFAMTGSTGIIMIDVLGGQYTLPYAFVAPAMSQPGTFTDRVQQQTRQWLGQITGGQADVAIVIYCSDPQCWLSYNAALRAIAAGYSNVYWYRGGLQAWQMAGQQLQPGPY